MLYLVWRNGISRRQWFAGNHWTDNRDDARPVAIEKAMRLSRREYAYYVVCSPSLETENSPKGTE